MSAFKSSREALSRAPLRLTAIVVAAGLSLYLLGLTIYAIASYSTTKSKLLTYGFTDASANLVGLITMLVALGLPALAVVRIVLWRPRLIDYGAALFLPLLSWAISQIPAKFDAVTGKELQYCAHRPDGTTFCLDRPGVDPLTRRALAPIDSSMAENLYRREKGLLPRPIATPVSQIAFFDSLSGEARVWASKNESGCYDLFDNPGIDPRTGMRLEAVTVGLVQAIRRCGPIASAESTEPPASQQSRLKSVQAGLPPPTQSSIAQPDRPTIGTPRPREVQAGEAQRAAESEAAAERKWAEAQLAHDRSTNAALLTRRNQETEAKIKYQQRTSSALSESQIKHRAEIEQAREQKRRPVYADIGAKYSTQMLEANTDHQQRLDELSTAYQQGIIEARAKFSDATAGLPQRRGQR